MARPLFLVLTLLSVTPAGAAVTYYVAFNGNSQSGSSPIHRSETYPKAASNGTATFIGEGFSFPGHVALRDHLDMTWSSGLSGGCNAEILCTAENTGFVISGPGGPVAGTLHFRFTAGFGREGGFPDNGATGSRVELHAIANNLWAIGSYAINNAGTTTATGIFAGQSGNAVDLTFTISGNFPVGSPFTVTLFLDDVVSVYGNVFNTNPGFADTNAGGIGRGLRLEEVGGVVMDLPPGYTLNAPDWGIVDNHYQSIVGVEPAPPAFALRVLPNPSADAPRLEFELPGPETVRVEIFDAAGRRVRTLAHGPMPAGPAVLTWNGMDDAGRRTSAGIYFARVVAGRHSLTRRLVRVQP